MRALPLALLLIAGLLAADARADEPEGAAASPDASGEITPAEALNPRPARLRAPAEQSGTVVLQMGVDHTGNPHSFVVEQSLDDAADAAALQAARRLLFVPARVGETTAASDVRVGYTFTVGERDGVFGDGDGPAESVGGAVNVVEERPWRVFGRRTGEMPDGPNLGTYEVGRRDLELMAGGLSDVTRAMHLQPGVSRRAFLAGSFSIRGGDEFDTVTYFDGIPLSNGEALGVFSRFNPTLLDRTLLHAGSQPSEFMESLSGIQEIRYVDPPNDGFHALVDLSPIILSGQVSFPLGKPGAPGAMMISARRSVIEGYLALFDALGVLSGLDMGYGDAFVRAWFQPNPAHEIVLTFLENDERWITDATDLLPSRTQRSWTLLGSARWTWKPTSRIEWTQLLATTWEATLLDEADIEVRRLKRLRPSLRSDFRWGFHGDAELHVGVDGAAVRHEEIGRALNDVRGWVPWSRTTRFPLASLAPPTNTTRWIPQVGAYAEVQWESIAGAPVGGRLGVRSMLANITGRPWVSPKGAVFVEAPSKTRFKFEAGLHQAVQLRPGIFESSNRSVDFVPSRTISLGVAIEQPLDFGLNIRAEGYFRVLDQLLTWTDRVDTAQTEDSFVFTGRGHAAGGDLVVSYRKKHGGVMVAVGGVHARRTNPEAVVGPQTYVPGFAAPFQLKMSGDIAFGKRRAWTISGNWYLTPARPMAMGVHYWDEEAENWQSHTELPSAGGTGWLNQLSVRVEGRTTIKGRAKVSFYAELANIRPDQGVEAWSIGALAVEDGAEPTWPVSGVWAALPLLPWVGVRIEL